MSQTEEIFQFKILMLGDSSVGKSSLMTRFTTEKFEENVPPTVGVDFKVRTLFIDGYQCKVQVWDTAGQERFHGITLTYYRDAAGVLIVYDVTNANSFLRVRRWLDEIDRNCPEKIARVLVGNKDDLNSTNKMVSNVEAKEYARERQLTFFETSARDNNNVYEIFYTVTYLALQERLNRVEKKGGTLRRSIISLEDNPKKKSKGICCK